MSDDSRHFLLPIIIETARCNFDREEMLHEVESRMSEPGVESEFYLGRLGEAGAAAEGGGEVGTGGVVGSKMEEEGEKRREEGKGEESVKGG